MNAPYFDTNPLRRNELRERHYPFLALVDTLLSWTIGLAALAVGLYALGRVALYLWPSLIGYLHSFGF